MFNKSLHTHQLPADWKKARITHIFKNKGEVNEPSNYRQIYVVSHIVENFGKCFNYQLLQYFENHSFLRHDRSALRKGHSNGMVLHKLENDLLDNIIEGMLNDIFFYLEICFDTINHDCFCLSFKSMVLKFNDFLLFTDYLCERSQAVTVDGCRSSFTIINFGVPQGSILGPLLFLIVVYSFYH